RAAGQDHLAGRAVTELGLVVVVLERALGRVRVGRPLHGDLRTVVALEEQVHDGRVGRGARLGDEVPLGVVTTRQEREVRVHHNVELARDRVAVRDVAGLRVGTHTLDDLTRGDGPDLLGSALRRAW